MKILKKTGSILFCLLPFFLSLGIQLLVTVAGLAVRILFMIQKDPSLVNELSSPAFLMELTSDSQFLAGLSAAYAVMAALIMGFWYRKRFVPKNRPRRKISAIINPAMAAGLVLLMAGMQYISTFLVTILAVINPAWYHTYEELLKSVGFGDVTLLLALYSVVIAPVSEELIFRGVTLKYAVRAMPLFLANTLQALLFGIFHGNVIQGVYAFAVGLFCGYVCLKGGSIYLSILFHILFNLWGTFAPDILFYSGDSPVIHLAILAGAVCLSATGAFLYQRGVENRSLPEG